MAVEAPVEAGEPRVFVRRGNLNRTIITMAWPVVLERLSLSVLSAVDLLLVGRYVGETGVAAVGIATLMFWIPLSGALAIDVGSTAVIARDVGAGDRSQVQRGLNTAILSALAWGVFCMALVLALAPQLMRVMGAEDDVVPAGVEFLRAGAIGLPFLMVLYAVNGALRGMGNTWMPMLVLVVSGIVNAVVTLVLINGWVAEMGVLASGIGYAAAGITGGGLALALAASRHSPIALDFRRLLDAPRSAFARLLRVGLPVGLEEAQFMLAFLVYTRIVSELGTDQLAAHTLALRSLEMAILPGFALGTAATALVGQYLGAGQPAIAEDVAKRVRAFALVALCVMAVAQFALAPYVVRLFVDDPDVVSRATTLLRVFAFALPGMAVHASLSGALRGAGDTRFVLGTFTLTAWGIRVPMAFLMVIVFGLSVPFAWLAAVTENWVRAGLVLRRFRQGRWKTMKV